MNRSPLHAGKARLVCLVGLALVGLALAGLALAGCGLTPPAPPPKAEPAPSPPPVPQTPQPPPPAPTPAPPPAPRAIITPERVLQGDAAVLRLDQPVTGDVVIRVKGLSEQPRPFELEGLSVAFIGFPADARVGIYPVTVTWTGGTWDGQIEVVRKAFTEDRLTVTEELEDTYYDPRSPEEWARVFALRSRSVPRPLWRGSFGVPLEGKLEVTTYFGEIRYVNGNETGRHSGMDFAADRGTPIHAPAPGLVILAEKLILSGNMVILDHGMGLFTAYYHCDTLKAKPGDWVTPGQVIATVGNTGFSLGDHLHWTATIGNTPVDPWPLTQEPPLGFRGYSTEPLRTTPF